MLGIARLGYSYLGTFSSAECLPQQAPEVAPLFAAKDGIGAHLAVAYTPSNVDGKAKTIVDVSPKGARQLSLVALIVTAAPCATKPALKCSRRCSLH